MDRRRSNRGNGVAGGNLSWRQWLAWWVSGMAMSVHLCAWSQSPTFRIAWFSQLYPEHSFWQQHRDFTEAAARDLNIELVAFYAYSDQIKYRNQLALAASHAEKGFDGMIIFNMKQQDRAIVQILDAGGVPAISNVNPMDFSKVGQPREMTSKWIGEVLMDEQQSGYLLTRRLLQEADTLNLRAGDGKIYMLAIGGTAADSVAIRRLQGLHKALAEREDVVLQQTFHTHKWSAGEAQNITNTALRRYPQVSVVWSANDDIALGVIAAANEMTRQPGQDLLTGGIDGTLAMMDMIQSGQAVCSVSGLFMQGAWSAVLLHDFLKGKDFIGQTGPVINVSGTVVDSALVADYVSAFGDQDWDKIDFSKFSVFSDHTDWHYDFSITRLLKQFQ